MALFLSDMWFLLRRSVALWRMWRGAGLDPRFRERMMLAVTEVNRCRLCSYGHTRAALMEGLHKDEVRELLSGQFDHVPKAELPGVLYAQHWAETEERTDPAADAALMAAYGAATCERIRLALRLVRIGNYTFNTADLILYRITFGLLGSR